MNIRVLIAVLACVVTSALTGLIVMQVEAKPVHQAQAGSRLEAQIKALQARVAALEKGASTGKSTQLRVSGRGPVSMRKIPSLTHKLKLTPLPASLKNPTARKTQMIILPIHPFPIVHPTSTVQGLTAQVAQLSSEVNQLSKKMSQLSSQIGSLQTAQNFDVNLLGEEINWVQTNLTNVANSVPVLPAGQGFCGGNGAMSWGGLKYYLNNSRMDNDLFCYLVQ
jgi:cell division protein FtsB